MKSEVAELATSIAKPFESLHLIAYWDPHPLGLPTQGWGRLLSRNHLVGFLKAGLTRAQADAWLQKTYPPIDESTADRWLEEDMDKANRAVLRLVNRSMTVGQEAAFTDFVYNCGGGNFQSSTMLRMFNRGDVADCVEEFPKWNKAGGRVLRGLTRRRRAEQLVFIS